MQLYKKVERHGVIEFVPISVPKREESYLKSLVSRNKQIDDLALYLSSKLAEKTYKEIATEIIEGRFNDSCKH